MAPTLTIFGSYFPAWTACLIAGCVAGILAHGVLKKSGLVAAVPFPAIFYLMTILLGANVLWMLVFV